MPGGCSKARGRGQGSQAGHLCPGGLPRPPRRSWELTPWSGLLLGGILRPGPSLGMDSLGARPRGHSGPFGSQGHTQGQPSPPQPSYSAFLSELDGR